MNNKRPPSSEGQSDDLFLKRLRTAGQQRRRKYSKVVVRLGPQAEEYEFPLFPLIRHSAYFRRRIESDSSFDNLEDPKEGSFVIDLPDYQCDSAIFHMVEDFCYGVMEESEISTSNIVQFFNVSKSLEMKSLTGLALTFLQEKVFISWESCLAVLATFDCKDLLSMDTVTEDPQFRKCETQIEICHCDDCREILYNTPFLPLLCGPHVEDTPPSLHAGLEHTQPSSDDTNVDDAQPGCDANTEECGPWVEDTLPNLDAELTQSSSSDSNMYNAQPSRHANTEECVPHVGDTLPNLDAGLELTQPSSSDANMYNAQPGRHANTDECGPRVEDTLPSPDAGLQHTQPSSGDANVDDVQLGFDANTEQCGPWVDDTLPNLDAGLDLQHTQPSSGDANVEDAQPGFDANTEECGPWMDDTLPNLDAGLQHTQPSSSDANMDDAQSGCDATTEKCRPCVENTLPKLDAGLQHTQPSSSGDVNAASTQLGCDATTEKCDPSVEDTPPNLDAGLEHNQPSSNVDKNVQDTQPGYNANIEETQVFEESNLFKMCSNEFLAKIAQNDGRLCKKWTMSCSVQHLLRVAELLPPIAASLIFQSCRKEQFGLFLYDNICSHRRGDPKEKSPSAGSVHVDIFVCPPDGSLEVRWIVELAKLLPDVSRRSQFVLHLSKMMRLARDVAVPTRSISSSTQNWGFLCALLVEATQLSTFAENTEVTTGLDEEVEFLQRLVAEGLGQVCYSGWNPDHSDLGLGQVSSFEDLYTELRSDLEEDPVFMLLMKFEFSTLLSIVAHFRSFVTAKNIVMVASMIDFCIQDHLKAGSFTTQQALLIYKEFPNHVRPSHYSLYKTLKTNTLSGEEMKEVTKLLDYDKLIDDCVEELFEELELGCEPQIVKRFMEIQRVKRIRKEMSDEKLNKLKFELHLRTAELMNAGDYMRLTEEKLNSELKGAIELQKVRHEEVIRLRIELRVKTQELLTAASSSRSVEGKLQALSHSMQLVEIERDEVIEEKHLLERERNDLIERMRVLALERDALREGRKLTESEKSALDEGKKIVESQRDAMQRDLEEEKQKTTCRICFQNPRDALCLPCMHFHFCAPCLTKHHQRQKNCPSCRVFTGGVLKCNLVM